MMDNETTRARVVYSCLSLPVKLALIFRMPMKDLVDLLQMAVYHETRRRGLKMREVSSVLDISMRKVSQLATRLRRNFAEEEVEEELPRRIEFMLWAEPLSHARILQLLRPAPVEDVEEALEGLLSQKRVRAHEEEDETIIYEVVRSEYRLVSQDWLARLDGLNNLLSTVANAVDARFFHEDSRAFARTVSLRIREEDMPRLHALYSDVIWETLKELDAAARDDERAQEIDLSIVWAPYEFLIRQHDLKEATDE